MTDLPAALTPGERARILEIAEGARRDGWQRWEADEPIKAAARAAGIDLDPSALADALDAAFGYQHND